MAGMARRKRAMELHIRCRECQEGFRWYLAPSRVDVTISCPFCSAFVLTIIEDFSGGAPTGGGQGRGPARGYRV